MHYFSVLRSHFSSCTTYHFCCFFGILAVDCFTHIVYHLKLLYQSSSLNCLTTHQLPPQTATKTGMIRSNFTRLPSQFIHVFYHLDLCNMILNDMILTWFLIPISELPWDQPSSSCTEFINWKDNDHWQLQTPWSKLDTLAISLLRKLLATSPGTRLTLEKTLDHKWCNMQFADNGSTLFLFKVHMNQCLYRCKSSPRDGSGT